MINIIRPIPDIRPIANPDVTGIENVIRYGTCKTFEVIFKQNVYLGIDYHNFISRKTYKKYVYFLWTLYRLFL